MTDNIDVVVKESGTQGVISSFDQLAASADRAHKSVSNLQKTFGNVGRSTAAANRISALGTAAQGATGHVNNLNSAMTSLNNTRVTANLNSANQALNNTSTSATRAATGVRDLLAAFISFNAIKSVIGSLIEAQVAMQQIHFGLMAATGSMEKSAVQMEYLRQNAQTLGLDLRTSAQEYTRLAASAEAMNVSMEDQQKLYTGLSRASTVLHLDAQKVQFATLALTQMFSKGKIQAEELRRQLGEAIPGVVPRFQKAVMEVVKGTDLAKYSFEELMKRGLLDTSKFLPQLIQALEETGRGWEEASKGLNAEINRLKTAWFELKVEVSKGLFTDVLIGVVRFLSSNLKELTGVVVGLGVAISIALAPKAIIMFTGYVKELAVAVWAAAGPWGILAGAIAGVIGYIVTMRNELPLMGDSLATVGDAGSVVFSDLKTAASDFYDYVKDIPGFISQLWDDGNKKVLKSSDDTTSQIMMGWLTIPKVLALAFDAVAATIAGILYGVTEIIKNYVNIWTTLFGSIAEGFRAAAKGDIEKVTEIKANVRSALAAGLNTAKSFSEGFDKGVNAYGFAATSYVDSLPARAEEQRRKRLADNLVFFNPDQDIPSPDSPASPQGAKGKKGGRRELDNLANELNQLISQISPTEAAMKKLAEAQEILNKVSEKGTPVMKALVEQMGGADHIMGLLKEKYKDALDPVGALNDKYDRELASLRAITPEQKATAVAQEVMNKARKDGYNAVMQAALGEAAYRRELEKTQAQLIASAESQVYQNSAGQQARGARAQVEGLVNQRNAGNIGPGQFAVGMKEAFGIEPNVMEQYQAQQEQYQAHLEAMQTLNAEYEAKKAATTGQANADAIAGAAATAEIIKQIEASKVQNTLSMVSGVLGQVSTLMSSKNKQMFKVGQAAALAQAGLNLYLGLSNAWALPFPLNVIQAAVVGATQLANISNIRSQQPPSFRTGGSMVVGGSGGIDSQLVQFNATPGEHVSINTPAEARAMQDLRDSLANREERGNIQMNLTVVQQGRPDNRTPEQNAREMRKQARKLGVV